jgi:signal peptidase I
VTAKTKSRSSSVLELVLIVAVAVGLALAIQAFLVKPYRIPSRSMEPTLDVGQRVLVNRVSGRLGTPAVGDIVVFHPPTGALRDESEQCGAALVEGRPCARAVDQMADVNFIKRIVAGPGDTLAIRDGHAVRNGKLQHEPFSNPCGGGPACDYPKPITIPPHHYFVMGDNRGASDDSRYWGPVPEDWIVGPAFATYWPPKRVGIL